MATSVYMLFQSYSGEICHRAALTSTICYLYLIEALLVNFLLNDRQISLDKRFSTIRTVFCPSVHALPAENICAFLASDRISYKDLANRALKSRIGYLRGLSFDSFDD